VAQDAFGNVAIGYRGTVHLASSDASAVLPADHAFTAADNGSYTFQGVILKTAGAPQSITATDTVTPTISGSLANVSVAPGPAAALVLTGPGTGTAGSSSTVGIEAQDSCKGNRVTGYTGSVRFSSSDPQATLPATYTFTAADAGFKSFPSGVVLRTAGTQTLVVTDGTLTTSSSVSVSPAAAATLILSGVVSPITAGTAATLTVQAKDAYGNLATNYTGTVRFTSSDAQAAVPANFSFSGSGGTHTFTNGVTLRTAGTQSVTAADTTVQSITGQQTGISVSAAGATSLAVTGTPPATAGVSTQATVTLYDPYGNVATGYLGTMRFTSSDLLATLPANRTFAPADAGAATVTGLTFRTAGTESLTATDTQSSSLTGTGSVAVAPGAAASLTASGFPSPSTAGVAGALTVTARDAWNNVATGYRGTVAFSSTDAASVLPATTTFTANDAGTRTFAATLKTAGAQSITASDGTLSASQTGISVVGAGAATLAVSGVTSPIGNGVWSNATIAAKDAYGNTATSYLGTVAFTSSDAQAVLAPSYTFVAGDSGIHTVSNAVKFNTVGTQSLTATDTVSATITGTRSGVSVVDLTPPSWPSNTSLISSQTSTTTSHLSWTAATDNVGVTAYRVYKDGALTQTISTLYADVAGFVVGTPSVIQIQAGDAAGNWSTNGPIVTVTTVPPDPVTVAPPLDPTIATTLADETAFLYTGPNAIQTGVAAGTIDAKRVSVARGTVRDRSGAVVPGVQVTVLSHPELGQTVTRANGTYDIALNGGSALTLTFQKAGLLDVQRTLNAVWQEFAQVDDVVMIPQDQLVTVVDMTNTTTTRAARGSVTTDEMGSRQATVLIPPGTTASLLMPNGSTQPVSTLHIRATEFTIGSSGPAAMPIKLPPTTAYTYAVSFNADEATAVGAKSVLFSQSVFGYVENFLAFRVGAVVPSGYHDHDQGIWIPQPNGRVLKVLSITGGLADVDTDGSGLPADATKLAALSFSNSERQQLASLYPPGQSLWRMPLQHFSCDDWNPSPAPLPDAGPPPDQPDAGPPPGCTNEKHNSIIECETQVLGERVDVVGTPYSLNYRSSRQMGRRANYRLDMSVPAAKTYTMPSGVGCFPASGRVPPCQLGTGVTVPVNAVVYADVAGRHYSTINTATTATTWGFEWDGIDSYGRRLQGEQPIKVRTCLTYPAIYYAENSDAGLAFAAVQNTGATLSWRSGSFAFDICNEWNGKIGGWDDRARALGGWTLSPHHAYDPRSQTLYRGDGTRTSGSDANRLVVNTVMGNGLGSPAPAEGAQARSVGIGDSVTGLATGPDGSIYVQYPRAYVGYEIWKMKPDGSLTLWVPNSAIGPAGNFALALAADGRLYISDSGNGSYPGRLLRRENDGTVSTLMTLPSSNGYRPGIAIGPEGAVYFSDPNRHRVMRRGTDGSVAVVAGLPNTTVGGFSGDGGLATQAQLNQPGALAVGLDGTLYIADIQNGRVRAVGVDGIIRTFAGNGPCGSCGYYMEVYSNDGAPATQAGIGGPMGLAVARDGTLYIGADVQRIRRVTPDGIIGTIQKGVYPYPCNINTIDCPAFGNIPSPSSIALEASGALLVSAMYSAVARISTGFTVAKSVGEQYVPSSDASEIYVFDLAGRHLRTLDGLTTATRLTFGYGGSGRLISITDQAGNVTTVQRDGQGNPTAIVGPYGQSTGLTLDGNGYLASITNPNNESVQLRYYPPVAGDNHTGGLLSQLTDPRLGIHLFEYTSDGFLKKDTPPDGAWQSLDRGGALAPTRVTHTTALGRTTVYAVAWNSNSKTETASVTDPAGFTTTTTTGPDQSTSTRSPDGMLVTTTATADPRFGMDAFSVSSTTKTPSGLTRTTSESRTSTMMSSTDPLTLRTLLTQITVNGRTSSSTYDGVAKTITQTTSAGRQTVLSLDSFGRVVQIAAPGVQPVVLHYDSRGRNDTITQGTRVTTLAYDAAGFLHSVLDPAQHTSVFAYDLAGRPKSETLPDASVIGMGYDANGNTISVTPPGRPMHVFAFTSGDLESDYIPPDVGQPRTTHTDYNLDRQVSKVSRPDGDAITPTYDTAKGRLTSLTTSRGTTSYGYSSTTGRLVSVTTPDGVGLTYGYDGSLLQDVTWSGLVSGNVHKTYDSSFRLASESVTGGQTINFGYDNDDLLTSAGAMTITRDPATGFVTGTTLGAISESRTYDAFGAEQTYTVSANSTTLYSVNYGTRDALGRIVNKTETIQGVTHTYGYTYDANGRLTDVAKDGVASSHYAYDANGNRTVGPGLVASPVYDNQDRLLSYGNCTYTYKADGSLQTKTCSSATTTYDYDAFGNLRHVTLPSGTNIDYIVDGQNRRIGKKVNGTLVESFAYEDDLRRVGWYDGTGALKAQFTFVRRQYAPDFMVKAGLNYRLVYDQGDAVHLVVDPSGAIVQRLDYDEYGNVLADTAPGFQPFGFGGGLRDVDTSLARLGARDYDATLGRWIGKDPLVFVGGSSNMYEYVHSDPVNSIDPDGLGPIGFPLPSPVPIWCPPGPGTKSDGGSRPVLPALGSGGPRDGPRICLSDMKPGVVTSGSSVGQSQWEFAKSCYYKCPPNGWRKWVTFQAKALDDTHCPEIVFDW
jgi:RHS repeat-associated protein